MSTTKNEGGTTQPAKRPQEAGAAEFLDSIIEAADKCRKMIEPKNALGVPLVRFSADDVERLRVIDRQIWEIWETNP